MEEGIDIEKKECIFRYNFLRYEFAHPKGVIWARSYVDEMDHVAVYPPSGVPITDEIVQLVIQYLARRYRDVHKLGTEGYESVFPS